MAGYRAKPPAGTTPRQSSAFIKGVSLLLPFNDRGGPTVRDPITRNNGALSGSFSWGKGLYGPELSFTTGYVSVPHSAALAVGTASFWFAFAINPADVSSVRPVVDKRTNGGVFQGYSLYAQGGQWNAQLNDTAGHSFTNICAAATGPQVLVWLVDRAANVLTVTIYSAAGVTVGTKSITAVTGSLTSTNALLLGENTNFSSAYQGSYSYASHGVGKVLTATQVAAIAADPFREFRRSRLVPVITRPRASAAFLPAFAPGF